MKMTQGEWAGEFLEFYDPAINTARNRQFLVNWQAGEGSRARFNQLNTTYHDGGPVDQGSTLFNSVGVRNYGSLVQGFRATAATLRLGYYDDINRLLRRPSAVDWVMMWRAIKDSPWGTFKAATDPADDANPDAPALGVEAP